ncbi:MAG: iron-sulfur cluster assembly scaffold protein [Woeseiaceae bacterium]
MTAGASPYNETVRRHFAMPAHAGDMKAGYARTFKAEASESGSGCRVVLTLAEDGGRIEAMCFRAFGCPHLIAAAEAHCAYLEGRPVAALHEFPVQGVMASLDVPVEKAGRLLLLEDAVIALARQVEDGGWNELRSK